MSKVMKLGKIGEFRLQRVLLQYDSPFIFTCVNEKNRMMIFAEDHYNDLEESWVSIFINDNQLYELLSGKKSIQETFINCDVHDYYLIKHTFNNDSYEYLKIKSFPDNILSPGRDFLKFDYKEEQGLINSLNKSYEDNLMPTMDFHFNKFSRSHSISVEFLINVLDKVKKVFNGIVRAKANTLEVEPCAGSVVLRFRAVQPDKTIDKNTSSYAFESIERILKSESPEEVSDVLIENPRILIPLKSLYLSLSKMKRDFEIAAVTDFKKASKYTQISNKTISMFYEKFKNTEFTSSEDKMLTGFLEGFDNIRHSFSFKSENGTIYKGKISKDINENNPKIQDRYFVTIVETTVHDIENAKEKKVYTLKRLEH